ncbi:MAG: penicillin-binding transpeptidase domain-containing protein, partial [Actinomycetota bacterium]
MSNLLSAFAAALVVAGLWVPAPAARPTDRAGRALPARVSLQLGVLGIAGATSLDGLVQRVADSALDDGLTQARSKGLFPTGGSVVVLGLRERALLGVASAPEPDRMRALEALPAGSVVKPFVALAALDEGIDASERRACPARFEAGGSAIRNWTGRDGPAMTIPEAIAQSCNTVFASFAATLWERGDDPARSAISQAFSSFGFGVPTGFVPGEQPGYVPPRARSIGDLMVLAIGQGPLTVTPLQVASGFARIAGVDASGWAGIAGHPLKEASRVPSTSSLQPVRRGLERAVRDGTAHSTFEGLDLNRVPIAGKTGSAEIGDVTPYAWFAAYAPADAPRYVVAVVIERGRRGAISAAPVARRVLDALLDL